MLDVGAAHDCGVPINPTAVESQIVGGVVMGLGAALGEQLLYEGGRLVNPAYLHYALPRAADVPPIRAMLLGHADPRAPYGVKGVGEISMVPMAPAVANAVAHAVGIRVRELPITPDKVLGRSAPEDARRHSLSRVAAAGALVDRGSAQGVPARVARRPAPHGTRSARSRPPRPIAEIVRPTTVDEAVERLAAGGRRSVAELITCLIASKAWRTRHRRRRRRLPEPGTCPTRAAGGSAA